MCWAGDRPLQAWGTAGRWAARRAASMMQCSVWPALATRYLTLPCSAYHIVADAVHDSNCSDGRCEVRCDALLDGLVTLKAPKLQTAG